jgi:hypothetical protein
MAMLWYPLFRRSGGRDANQRSKRPAVNVRALAARRACRRMPVAEAALKGAKIFVTPAERLCT